jgi:hypothetical protein
MPSKTQERIMRIRTVLLELHLELLKENKENPILGYTGEAIQCLDEARKVKES